MGPGATRSTASAAVEAVLSSILSLTEGGERLQITQFGAFERKLRPARRAYNISTGEMEEVPAHERLSFFPARDFPVPRRSRKR